MSGLLCELPRSRGRSAAVVRWIGATALLCAGCIPPAPPPPRPTEAELNARTAAAEQRAAAALEPTAASKHASRKDGLEGGALVFSDDFERGDLGSDWIAPQVGEWDIDNGRLRANKVPVYEQRNKGVWLQRRLPAKTRIEFEAEVLSDKGDVKCEVFAKEAAHESGYSIIFGGWNNTINTIARRGEHEASRAIQRPHQPVKSHVVQRWAVVRNDNVVRWYVDGAFMLAYDDSDPVRGPWFGLNNWLSDVRFDNVRIFDLDAPAGAGADQGTAAPR